MVFGDYRVPMTTCITGVIGPIGSNFVLDWLSHSVGPVIKQGFDLAVAIQKVPMTFGHLGCEASSGKYKKQIWVRAGGGG